MGKWDSPPSPRVSEWVKPFSNPRSLTFVFSRGRGWRPQLQWRGIFRGVVKHSSHSWPTRPLVHAPLFWRLAVLTCRSDWGWLPESALAEVLGPQVFLSLASTVLLSFFRALRSHLLSKWVQNKGVSYSSVFSLRIRREPTIAARSLSNAAHPTSRRQCLSFMFQFHFYFFFYLHSLLFNLLYRYRYSCIYFMCSTSYLNSRRVRLSVIYADWSTYFSLRNKGEEK